MYKIDRRVGGGLGGGSKNRSLGNYPLSDPTPNWGYVKKVLGKQSNNIKIYLGLDNSRRSIDN